MDESGEKKILNSSDIDKLKYSYGKDVLSYLSESNVIEKKTNKGAFILSKYEHLQQCQQRFKVYLDKKSHWKKKKIIQTTKIQQKNFYELPGNLNGESHEIVNIMIDDISFEESFEKRIEWLIIPKKENLIIRKDWNYDEIFCQMSNSKLYFEDTTQYEECLELIKPIFKEFHRNHENFDYNATLKHILQAKKNKGNKSTHFISLYHFQKYFSRIFSTVIPLKFFGNNRNVKKIRGVLKKFYLSPYGEKISLKSFVERINEYCFAEAFVLCCVKYEKNLLQISCITWLEPIKAKVARYSIFANVIKWIFEYYISAVLKTVFQIKKAFTSNQKQFLVREKWKTEQLKYIRNKEKKEAIVRLDSDSKSLKKISAGHLILIPKKSGIRSICVSPIKKNSDDGKLVALLKTLLQQLYYEKYGFSDFNELHTILKSYRNLNEENSHCDCKVVACDVKEAFDSIIQAKLFDIVNAIINEIPRDMLSIKWYAILTRPVIGFVPKLDYKQGFTCCSETPLFSHGSLVSPIDDTLHRTENMNKRGALICIKNYIFDQTFQFNKRIYLLKQGITQGGPLSSILAEIYYATMKNQEFQNFIQSDTLFRYVDDFLFISKNNNSATNFLQVIKNGIAEYNCSFNVSKIQTNVRSSLCKESKSIHYVGYRINSNTLNVSPEFESISYRYSLKFTPQLRNSIEAFSTRLKNMKTLKLNRIVLEAKTNSADEIITIARLSAYRMASRCAILILAIFEKTKDEMKNCIMKEICFAIAKFARIFKRHLKGSSGKTKHITEKIIFFTWSAFFRVFAKYYELRKFFCNHIKFMMKLLKTR